MRPVATLGIAVIAIACGGASTRPTPPWSAASVDDDEREEPVVEQASTPAVAGAAEAPAPGGSDNALDAQYAGAPVLRTLRGRASYYHDSLAGNGTANGDVYDPGGFTAAHRSLPFGTIVRVTRIDNGRVVHVRVNDRGPFGRRTRILDLSRAAAEQLDMIRAGVTDVRVEVVHVPE